MKFNVMLALAISAMILQTAFLQAAKADDDLAAGEQSFKKCLACHAIGEGARNKIGPVLNGLAGRPSGTIAGYSYSDANKNSGITWNKEQFLEYIRDPRAKIPDTKMIFAGIRNETEAANLWAYLAAFGPDGDLYVGFGDGGVWIWESVAADVLLAV